MPLMSAFTGFGQLRFSSKPSRHRMIYDALKVGIGGDAGPNGLVNGAPFDLSVGTHQEAKLYATAHGMAMADGQQERAGNQAIPLKCVEMLPSLEQDYLVVPGPFDTVQQRQANVQARKLLPGGASYYNLVAILRLALGTDFVALATSSTLGSDSSSSTGPSVKASNVAVPPKYLQLLDPIVNLGTPQWVNYQNLDPSTAAIALYQGDAVVVQPGNTGLMEAVTVSAVQVVAGIRQFQATFAFSHDIGAVVTTANWPYQTATTRQLTVVVKPAAAADPIRRGKVNDLMARATRGVSTWVIVQSTTTSGIGGTIGPDTLPFPLGAVSIGAANYTNST